MVLRVVEESWRRRENPAKPSFKNGVRLRPQARGGAKSPKATARAQRGWAAKRGPIRAKLKNGGGAGSCTRVRKYIPAGIYDAYPRLKCRARREDVEKPPGTNPEKSRRDRPRQPVTASLLK